MKTQRWILPFSIVFGFSSFAAAYLSEEPVPVGQFILKTLAHPSKVGTVTLKHHKQGAKIEFEGVDLRKGKYTLLVSLACPSAKELRSRKPASLGTEVVDFATESGEMWIEHTIRTEDLSLEKPDQALAFLLVRRSGAQREIIAASPCTTINPASPSPLPAGS